MQSSQEMTRLDRVGTNASADLEPPQSRVFGCSLPARIATGVYQLLSASTGGILLAFGHPEFAIPVWAAQGCCGFGWLVGTIDGQRQFRKELDRLANYISKLTEEQIQLQDTAKGVKDILRISQRVVVKEGFGQVRELNHALRQVSHDGQNQLEVLDQLLNSVVQSQGQILQSMAKVSRSGIGLVGLKEDVKEACEQLDLKVSEIMSARKEGDHQLAVNIRRINQLNELKSKGCDLLDAVGVILADLVAVNRSIKDDRENLKSRIDELGNLSVNTDQRTEKVTALVTQIQTGTDDLYGHLLEAHRLIKENEGIVALINQVAEKVGGMEELASRIERMVMSDEVIH